MGNETAPNKNPMIIGLLSSLFIAAYAIGFASISEFEVNEERYRKALIGMELIGFVFSLLVFPKHNVNQFMLNVFICMVCYTLGLALAATTYMMF